MALAFKFSKRIGITGTGEPGSKLFAEADFRLFLIKDFMGMSWDDLRRIRDQIVKTNMAVGRLSSGGIYLT